MIKMGIKTVPQPLYSPDVSPCDFWLFPKLTGCRYETIEERKEVVTEVIDPHTQEDFHGALQKLLERYNKGISAGGYYFEGDKISINKSDHTETYLMIIVYIQLFSLEVWVNSRENLGSLTLVWRTV